MLPENITWYLKQINSKGGKKGNMEANLKTDLRNTATEVDIYFFIWSLTAQAKNQGRRIEDDKLKEEEDGVW